MVTQQKSFFARYWGWFVGGAAALLIGIVAVATLLYLFVLRGNLKVTGLELAKEQAEAGSPVTASVTVENKGVFAKTFEGVLLVDGVEQSLQQVEVTRSEPQTVTCYLGSLAPGNHLIEIGSFSKQLKILKPAEFTVSDFTISSEKVLVGDKVTAKAKVYNGGEVEGTYTAQFTFDGAAVMGKPVKIGPGVNKTVEVEIPVTGNGDHEIGIEGKTLALSALKPASIEVTDFTISKAVAKPNETLSLVVTLTNSGDIAGNYDLTIYLNGEPAKTETLAVDPNTSSKFDYTYTPTKAGKVSIQIGELVQTVNVVVITRPANGALLVKKANSGMGRITLTNNYTDRDAVFVLASTSNPKAPLLTVYLRAGSKAKNIKIKDGNYIIYYMLGKDYDSASKRFITNLYMGRFDDPIAFKTTKKGYTTYYSVWNVSLNVTSGGNANTSTVDNQNFPD